jgi:hypothetical protein
MEAIVFLEQDHRRLAELAGRLEALAPGDPRRAPLAEMLRDELDTHARLEQEILYPALRENGVEPYDPAAPAGDLSGEVLRHIEREEDPEHGALALARARLSSERRGELGVEMAARRESLTSAWIGAATGWLSRLRAT